MRRDMERVLIQRPRVGFHGYPRHRAKAMDWTQLPEKQGMRACYGDAERKYFTDHLGPLRRFLTGSCGRSWDRVFAEVRASCDYRSLRGFHLLRHLSEEVQRPGQEFSYWPYFVDDAGILRVRPRRRFPAADVARDVISVDERLRYERIRDSWFAVERDDGPELRLWNRDARRWETRLCAPDDLRRWKKRQLGKRELRRLRSRGVLPE